MNNKEKWFYISFALFILSNVIGIVIVLSCNKETIREWAKIAITIYIILAIIMFFNVVKNSINGIKN